MKLVAFATLLNVCSAQTPVDLVTKPENAAAKVGDPQVLNCSVSDFETDNPVEWRRWAANDPMPNGMRISISTSGDVLDGYQVSIGADGEYNLYIESSAYDIAGNYQCQLPLADVSAEAEFISLSAMGCSHAPENDPFVVDQEVNLVCEVSYTGRISPTLQWWSPLGLQPSEISYEFNEDGSRKLVATANLTAEGRHDDLPFTCRLSFTDDQFGIPPRYEDECETSFLVNNGANNVRVWPDPDTFEGGVVQIKVGEQMNCTADGRPEPTYSWHDESGSFSEIIEGQYLLITESMMGRHTARCEAANFLDGNQRTANRRFEFYASSIGGEEVVQAGTPGWVIAVAVVVPILVIAGVLIVVYIVLRRSGKLPSGIPGSKRGPPTEPVSSIYSSNRPDELHIDLSSKFPPPQGADAHGGSQIPPESGYPPLNRHDTLNHSRSNLEAFDDEPRQRKPIYSPINAGIPVLPPGGKSQLRSQGSVDAHDDYDPTYEEAIPVRMPQQQHQTAYPRGNRGPMYPTQGPPPPTHAPPPAPTKRSKKKKRKEEPKSPDTGPGQADIYGSTHSLTRMAGIEGDMTDPTIGTRGYNPQ